MMKKLFNAYPIGPEILSNLENEKTLIAPAGELVIKDKKEEIVFLPHGHKKKKDTTEEKLTLGEREQRLKNI